MNLLEVSNLRKFYPLKAGPFQKQKPQLRAVDGVSFEIEEGEAFGLVGESGSGKTTIGHCILRLIEPNSGEIKFEGQDLISLSQKQMQPVRKKMQAIFQDPYGSLNPGMTAEKILEEPLLVHNFGDRKRRKHRVQELLLQVGLDLSMATRYPRDLSSGQRQRIGIARAIALAPRFIVADEPVSSLDLSIQTQILNLLQELQKSYRLAFLLIAHDLAMVHHFCRNVAVLYCGTIAEVANATELYRFPLHPYTRLLLDSIPAYDPAKRERQSIDPGESVTPAPVDAGCRFHPRCPIAIERCKREEPQLREVGPGHRVACHLG